MSGFQEHSDQSTYDPYWEGLKDGDKSALKALYEHYANMLYNYGRHISKDSGLVRDCIQDLFIELWQNHKHLSSTTSVKFYLYKCLRRKLIYEGHRIEKQLSNRGITEEKVDIQYLYEFSETDAILTQKRKSEVQKLLNTLPSRQREVLTLVFFENLTRTEAAQVMEVDTSTVYSLIWRAISSLKKEIQDKHPAIFFLSISICLLIIIASIL
ncbi:RNA polymerase sigma factor [Catalinimonas sp. 4WD22]|uniref:RNA polymerase sigma factor n=1 Tax=Catalinimonas locisalis TaxID=3133978 RepID=UPI00310121B2